MSVGQEEIAGARDLVRTPSGVESEAGRVDPKPSLLARHRPALDRKLAQPELGPGWRAPRALAQISVYTQRRIGSSRRVTLSASGSINQRAAATEESSELPSWGVKQKP